MSKEFYSLSTAIALPVVGGYMSGWYNHDAIDTWYQEIRKPPITPPELTFPIVWSLCYSSMGYASYRVYTITSFVVPTLSQMITAHPSSALPWYIIQLAFNFAWSPLFFWYRQIGWGAIDCGLILASLVPATISFWRVEAFSGKLMTGYLAWATIATVINVWIWKDNRQAKFIKKKDGFHLLKSEE